MSKIYFIGGAPRSGKTTAIQELIKRKPMLAASTDAIRNVAKGMTTKEENPRLHKVGRGDFSSEKTTWNMRNDPQTVLLHENNQSEEVWKSTLDFIGYYQRDGKDAAIEGVAVLPKELSKVQFDFSAVFLAPTGNQAEAILKHALENEDDWLHKYSEEVIKSYCRFSTYWNKYYLTEAEKYGFSVVKVDYDNFESSISKAVRILVE